MDNPAMRNGYRKAMWRERARLDKEMAREGFVRWAHVGAPAPKDPALYDQIFRFRRLSSGKAVRYGPKWLADLFAHRAEAKLPTKLIVWEDVVRAMTDESERKALWMEHFMEVANR